MRFFGTLCLSVIVVCALGLVHVSAQSVLKSVVGGGGTTSKSAGVVVSGTVGQPVIGRVADARGSVLSGFWYSVALDPRVGYTTGGSTTIPGGSTSTVPIAVTPHPVTTISTIKVAPECTGVVSVEIVDLAGEKVATVFNEYTAGEIIVNFDSNGLVSGTYLLRVKTPCSERSQRLMILH